MHDLTELLASIAPFIMVLGIIWIVSRRKLEEKRIAATAESSSEKAAQYVSRVSELEQRVQVLERIITDRGYDVATQIEALRDQRRVDEARTGQPMNLRDRETA